MPRLTSRQCHRANTVTADTTIESYFRLNITVQFLDHLIQEFTARFSEENKQVVQLLSLIPSILTSKNDGELADLSLALKFWKQDLPHDGLSLTTELKEWRDLWKQCDAQSQPHNLCDSLKKCDEDQFPNLFVLLKLGCTLPVTSCEAERSFSALRRTMTSLRSSMGENRLAGLTLMNIHRDVHVDQLRTNHQTIHCRITNERCLKQLLFCMSSIKLMFETSLKIIKKKNALFLVDL